MPLIVNVHDAKTHFSKLLEQAHAGQEIVLAKAGQPYARMVPLAKPQGSRQPGRLNGRIGAAFFEPLPDGELAAWEGEREFCSTPMRCSGGGLTTRNFPARPGQSLHPRRGQCRPGQRCQRLGDRNQIQAGQACRSRGSHSALQ